MCAFYIRRKSASAEIGDFMGKPIYVAKKSGFSAIDIRLILLFWLIYPLIRQIQLIIRAKTFRMTIYEDRIVTRIGILDVQERQTLFMGMNSLSFDQGFWGTLLDYGTVHIVCPGRHDVFESGILDPATLKRVLSKHFVSPEAPHIVVGI